MQAKKDALRKQVEFHKKREDKAKVRFQMGLALAKRTLTRRGSRINTDRFPKRASKAPASSGEGGGVQAHAPHKKFFDFNSLRKLLF